MRSDATTDAVSPCREGGSSLVSILIFVLAILSLVIAGLSSATSGLRVSSNYQSGAQATLAAESGITHARKVIDESGVVRFDADVVARWGTLFGTAERTMSGYPLVRYAVTAQNGANALDEAIIEATGLAANESERMARARVSLGSAFSPGAIYLINDDAEPNFNGNSFLVDGFDHLVNGALAPSPREDAPGITTHDADVRDAVLEALSAEQEDNVEGAGGVPSVRHTGGPSITDVTSRIIPNILDRTVEVTNPTLTGNDQFGTLDHPQVTRFTGDVTINGTVDGVGILIVEGSLTITGNSTFTGWIIVNGTTDLTAVTGSTSILGSIWTTDLEITVGGASSVAYSSAALALADTIAAEGNLVPRHAQVLAWQLL